ncbi:hypothetical protein [Aliirhizobium cellulosilyticum]|uniref:Uncharacterized protein n=1 Tax=Aliirhizobium cellulosilyticum TaxID=393664 RepID=A0A7W6Y2D0_9HYPH|nr:hypothetical protein [Rhizobium cellulosilyticum]MBB4349448.1 hypothetical protein [Rhizobium cellulosilyticum]MBB4412330.1 hypothetical protein [Rhizobium cellulosilyticum]MBB4446961.1 hypothetical protein [Rhizobium cellulosilyticum]
MSDNDNRSIFDLTSEEEALRTVSLHLKRLHQVIEHASEVIERLKEVQHPLGARPGDPAEQTLSSIDR